MLRKVFCFAMMFAALGVVATAAATTTAAAETATLKVQVVYEGKAEPPKEIKPNTDKEFCGKHKTYEERLLVDPETKGIKNVVLYIYVGGRNGMDLKDLGTLDIKPSTKVLDNDKCRFEPRVLVMHVDDTLKIKNSDAVAHNAKVSFFNNPEINPVIPANGFKEYKLEEPEGGVVPVECSIHTWMRAGLLVLDHRFAGISNEKGEIEISGLPAGKELTFRIYQEELRIRKMKSEKSGKDIKISRGALKLTLEPGENDLGKWVVPAK
ncbi:MAG: methylamine utilization protein [Planctomycetota bacterium]